MWPFRSRPAGKHALGAAVTAIPAAPVVPPAAPGPVPEAAPEPVQGPRVELGFRDGTTAALAPGSVQAKALSEIASVLARRDH